MNKETISYVRHIMGSDFVQLDFLNAIISAAIIVVSLIAFATGELVMFGSAFALGGALAFFNVIKSVMKKTAAGVVTFGALFIVLVGIVVYIFKILAV